MLLHATFVYTLLPPSIFCSSNGFTVVFPAVNNATAPSVCASANLAWTIITPGSNGNYRAVNLALGNCTGYGFPKAQVWAKQALDSNNSCQYYVAFSTTAQSNGANCSAVLPVLCTSPPSLPEPPRPSPYLPPPPQPPMPQPPVPQPPLPHQPPPKPPQPTSPFPPSCSSNGFTVVFPAVSNVTAPSVCARTNLLWTIVTPASNGNYRAVNLALGNCTGYGFPKAQVWAKQALDSNNSCQYYVALSAAGQTNGANCSAVLPVLCTNPPSPPPMLQPPLPSPELPLSTPPSPQPSPSPLPPSPEPIQPPQLSPPSPEPPQPPPLPTPPEPIQPPQLSPPSPEPPQPPLPTPPQPPTPSPLPTPPEPIQPPQLSPPSPEPPQPPLPTPPQPPTPSPPAPQPPLPTTPLSSCSSNGFTVFFPAVNNVTAPYVCARTNLMWTIVTPASNGNYRAVNLALGNCTGYGFPKAQIWTKQALGGSNSCQYYVALSATGQTNGANCSAVLPVLCTNPPSPPEPPRPPVPRPPPPMPPLPPPRPPFPQPPQPPPPKPPLPPPPTPPSPQPPAPPEPPPSPPSPPEPPTPPPSPPPYCTKTPNTRSSMQIILPQNIVYVALGDSITNGGVASNPCPAWNGVPEVFPAYCPTGTSFVADVSLGLASANHSVSTLNLGTWSKLVDYVLNDELSQPLPPGTNLVSLYIGVNDVKDTTSATSTPAEVQAAIDHYENSYDQVLAKIQAQNPNIQIILLNVPNMQFLADYTDDSSLPTWGNVSIAMSKWINAKSMQYPVIDNICNQNTYTERSGLHPNDAGHQSIAAHILDALSGQGVVFPMCSCPPYIP